MAGFSNGNNIRAESTQVPGIMRMTRLRHLYGLAQGQAGLVYRYG